MNLTELVVVDSVIPELESTDRNGVIQELVASLARSGVFPDSAIDEVVRGVIAREMQGSTGFGKGVAVPHAKHPAIQRRAATIGRSTKGVDFAALDRQPVYTILLVLSPLDDPDGHLAAMEKIFRHLQRDSFRRFLRQAETRQAIADLITEADELQEE